VFGKFLIVDVASMICIASEIIIRNMKPGERKIAEISLLSEGLKSCTSLNLVFPRSQIVIEVNLLRTSVTMRNSNEMNDFQYEFQSNVFLLTVQRVFLTCDGPFQLQGFSERLSSHPLKLYHS